MVDEGTRKTLSRIPLLKTKAGPRDKELWPIRLKEEYQTLIKYVQNNKDNDNDWFRLESNKDGTQWFGKCWHIHELMKYEFGIEFDIPVTYPLTAPEIAIPELDGKTAKMYRGGKICLTDHFKPLWGRNVPKFGIAQAMALGDTTVLGLDDKRKRSPSPESNSKRLRNESPVSRVLLECTICLQEVSNGMEFLPCGHCFHPDCIRSWFLTDRRKSCPICRNSFTTSVPDVESLVEDDPIHGVDDSISSTETLSLDEASSDEETTSSEDDSSDDSSSSDEYSRSVLALAVLTLCVVIRRRFR